MDKNLVEQMLGAAASVVASGAISANGHGNVSLRVPGAEEMYFTSAPSLRGLTPDGIARVGAALAPDDGDGRVSAEPWYRLAFDRAGELDARTARLRAATRLARMRLAEGDRDAAARTLGPVYDTFTEGFSTADLRDARDLLDVVAPGRHGPSS